MANVNLVDSSTIRVVQNSNNISLASNANEYSTTETVIGTWINGKPLYRKVLTANRLANNGVLTINHNIQNLEKVTKMSYSWYDTQDNKWYEGMRWDSATVYIKPDGIRTTGVFISCIGTNWGNRTRDVTVVLEYTKTTD